MIAGWGCETGCIGIPMIGTGDLLHPNQKQPIGPVNHHGKSHENHENRIFFIYVLISQSASPKSPTLYHLYIS